MILTIYIPQMSSFRVIAIFTVSEFFKTPPRSSSTDIRNSMCCSVLQCAAVCCSVLQCVVVNYSVLHRLVWHGSCKRHRRLNVLQCAAMCRSVLSVLQCSTVCYSVLQCVAIYEKALIPFSQCFSVFRTNDTRQHKATFFAVIFAQMAVNPLHRRQQKAFPFLREFLFAVLFAQKAVDLFCTKRSQPATHMKHSLQHATHTAT